MPLFRRKPKPELVDLRGLLPEVPREQSTLLLKIATDWVKRHDHMVQQVTNVEANILDFSWPTPTQRFVIDLTYVTLHLQTRTMRLDTTDDINSLGLSVLSRLIDGTER